MKRIAQARRLRQSAGLAERRVWARLKRGSIDGFRFRRQHPVGPYIADFACEALKLMIEIDGGVHRLADVVLRDQVRQADIEQRGWTVIRFPDAMALHEPWQIDDAIRAHARAVGTLSHGERA